MANAKDLVMKALTSVHEGVYRATKGRLAGAAKGMPVLILTTVGRKSGQRRTTMLTAPVVDGDTLVLVASYGGDDRHPSWYLNLRENPDVEVTRGTTTTPMRARVASAAEKADLWPRVVAAYKGYGGYQERTKREIPLVILEPEVLIVLSPSARELLESDALGHLVTVGADGSPQVAVVWVGLDGAEVVTAHLDPNQQKLRNLRRDPRVALSIETDHVNAYGLCEYLVLRGRARLTEGGAPALLQRLAHTYLGPDVTFPPFADPPPGVIVHIAIERVGGVGPWRGDL